MVEDVVHAPGIKAKLLFGSALQNFTRKPGARRARPPEISYLASPKTGWAFAGEAIPNSEMTKTAPLRNHFVNGAIEKSSPRERSAQGTLLRH